MQHKIKIVCITPLLLLSMACSAQESVTIDATFSSNQYSVSNAIKIATNKSNRANKMTTLILTIATQKITVLEGTPLKVPLTLKNEGAADINVHGPDSPSTYEYILRSDDGKNNIVLSEERVLLERLGDRIPPLPAQIIVLSPGQTTNYEDDLQRLSSAAIPAGSYKLSVSYNGPDGRIESPPIPLEITPLDVQAVAMYANTSPFNYLSSIFTRIDNKTQNVSIFQRDSKPDNPRDGISYFRHTIVADALTGFATAIEMGNMHDARWMAWLEGNRLHQQLSGREKIYLTVDSLDTKLTDTQLFPIGWQMNVSDGWSTSTADVYFSLLGLDEKKQLNFSFVKLNAQSGDTNLYPVSLNMSAQIKRWKVKAQFGEAGPVSFHLLLASVDSMGVEKLEIFSIDPMLGKINTQINLPIEAGKIEALSMNPASTDKSTIVDVLLSTNPDRTEMKFLRFAIDGDKSELQYSHHFSNSKNDSNDLANNWALPSLPLTPPIAVARLKDDIIARELTKKSTEILVAKDQVNSSLLNIELIGDRIWIIWFSKKSGFNYKELF